MLKSAEIIDLTAPEWRCARAEEDGDTEIIDLTSPEKPEALPPKDGDRLIIDLTSPEKPEALPPKDADREAVQRRISLDSTYPYLSPPGATEKIRFPPPPSKAMPRSPLKRRRSSEEFEW